MTRIRSGSLILTVLNEAPALQGFLASVDAQRILPAEIVVVDGGSTDGTAELFHRWVPPEGCTVRVLEKPGANISAGRNAAIAHAQHERILVTDAGTSLEPEWAEALLDEFDSPDGPDGPDGPDVVSGFFRASGRTFIERTIAFTITPRLSEVDPERFLPSSRSVAFTRAAWSAVGGYPEWLDYCEDLVFDLRLKARGFTFAFTGRAMVTWSARPTIPAFMTQYFRYARGDGKAGLWRRRHLARYGAYVTGLLLLALAVWQPWVVAVLLIGGMLYLKKFWLRLWGARSGFGASLIWALLISPVVVVAGDLAKMCGYPVGLRWRRTQGASVGAR